MEKVKTVNDVPVQPDDLDGLDWTELAVLVLAYGRASAGGGVQFNELVELSDNEDPKAEIIGVLRDLEEDGLLTLPRIFQLPPDTIVRPIIPGGSPYRVARQVKGPPTWSTKKRIWGLWISKVLSEEFIAGMREVQTRMHTASHAGDIPGKVAAQEDRVRMLEEWSKTDPDDGAVARELERQRIVLDNERTNLVAYTEKRANRS